MSASSPWWAPHVHADRRPFLAARGRVTAAARDFFRSRGFTEIELLRLAPGFRSKTRRVGGDHRHATRQRQLLPSRAVVAESIELALDLLAAGGVVVLGDRSQEGGFVHGSTHLLALARFWKGSLRTMPSTRLENR